MRQRLIDGALLAGLVVVAFAIMWTLFTLGRDGAPRSTDTTPAITDADAGVEPLDPADSSDTPGATGADDGAAIVPLDPQGDAADAETVPDDGDAATGDASDDAAAPADEAPAPEAAPLEPLPPGDVQLARVGFSFVTGGAGACGVTLEPWVHVAVSRDILAELGCGAEVTVALDDTTDGRTTVNATIADTMNPVHSRTVNIYVGEDEPALEYGVTAGVLER